MHIAIKRNEAPIHNMEFYLLQENREFLTVKLINRKLPKVKIKTKAPEQNGWSN